MSETDLRAFGWAPGRYMINCIRCNGIGEGDKRATSCRWCASDLLITTQSTEITKLKAEVERLTRERDALKLEAQGHAMEARTANHTIAECYQAVTGGKGEPGNWSGANPVREYVTRSEAERDGLAKALERVVCIGKTRSEPWPWRADDMVEEAEAALSSYRNGGQSQ
ncbi:MULTISPECIES: hypothetical protein [unclassified Sinorhizobium]|uniref:hypothetical protein n=1 Tax=unclassified Sinorhizobium TaxID=2613772 RepID=UPI003525F29D